MLSMVACSGGVHDSTYLHVLRHDAVRLRHRPQRAGRHPGGRDGASWFTSTPKRRRIIVSAHVKSSLIILHTIKSNTNALTLPSRAPRPQRIRARAAAGVEDSQLGLVPCVLLLLLLLLLLGIGGRGGRRGGRRCLLLPVDLGGGVVGHVEARVASALEREGGAGGGSGGGGREWLAAPCFGVCGGDQVSDSFLFDECVRTSYVLCGGQLLGGAEGAG